MGILNLTPDSFSDGGDLLVAGSDSAVSLPKALDRARAMLAAGASIIDVGGESTRPGADVVSSQQEMDRVFPVIEALSREFDVVISVDTSNPEIIARCADFGVGLVNDVRALSRTGAVEALAQSGLPVCLMHMRGEPVTMQDQPVYRDVIAEVKAFLQDRIQVCNKAGIGADRIMVDPGFGFGKTLMHNVEILRRLDEFQDLALPVLIGVSRKSMLGALTGRSAKDRMAGGLAAAVMAVMQGARIVRTHDVQETVDALRVADAVLRT
ncbi:MAG: dihydropteroate synthase [Pseudomonadales bacterium]|nr:dihydropteroate synthase [Pseudomonadales bacterium]